MNGKLSLISSGKSKKISIQDQYFLRSAIRSNQEEQVTTLSLLKEQKFKLLTPDIKTLQPD